MVPYFENHVEASSLVLEISYFHTRVRGTKGFVKRAALLISEPGMCHYFLVNTVKGLCILSKGESLKGGQEVIKKDPVQERPRDKI